jgi:3-deoxy-D-manno-octulosonic-acid transferase
MNESGPTRLRPARPSPSPLAGRAAYAAYDVAGALAAALALPLVPWLRRRGLGEGLRERLGRVPSAAWQLPAPPVWIHCASVGEVRSAAPLAQRLRERVGRPLVVSTTTVTGRAVAAADLGADVATLLPVDALRVIDHVFRYVRPRVLIVVESELWPGLLRAAGAVGAPAAIVSGRLSARSAERYRWAGPLFRAALARVAAFGMQTAADAARMIALGAAADRVQVTGTLKAGEPPRVPAPLLGGLAERRVLIAASTQPGEEEFVLQAFAALRRVYRDALLVLAPRRPERFDAVMAMVAAAGFPAARRSQLNGGVPADVQVMVLDSLGELVRLYPSAWAAFVGGTIAPLGGHNVLEPAAYARPVAFGPHTENVAAAARDLCAAGGARVVASPSELIDYWDALLARRDAAEAAGERARVVALRGDALEPTWRLLAPLLGVSA